MNFKITLQLISVICIILLILWSAVFILQSNKPEPIVMKPGKDGQILVIDSTKPTGLKWIDHVVCGRLLKMKNGSKSVHACITIEELNK